MNTKIFLSHPYLNFLVFLTIIKTSHQLCILFSSPTVKKLTTRTGNKYKDLENQFLSVKARQLLGCAKISGNVSFPSKRSTWMQSIDQNKPLQKVLKRIQHYTYLFKLYAISIILLLINNLTNICSEISEIWMSLWWFIVAT